MADPSDDAGRSDPATADTQIGAPTTDEVALAERLTRDRIHRTLFGELTHAPTIGRYTFLKEIGHGGMGVVCTAYDPKLDRKVAIKLTRSLASASAERRGRILREAQAMARLSHPNVVQVYEVGELRDELFVAMEYVDGVDLSEWLAAEPRTWRDVQRVFLAAGHGLAAAHAARLVHRDFKPANVLVGADGRVLVGDFGLARAIGALAEPAPEPGAPEPPPASSLAAPLTAHGALLGTPAYMAPEALACGVSDEATDQFAFCVALFEALHGARPFTGRDVAALVHSILEDEPRVPPGSAVPAWLQQIVLRGLQKRPEARWPSMHALLAALAHDPAARARTLRRGALAVSVVTAAVLGLGWLAADARDRAAHEEAAKLTAEAARDRAFDDLRLAADHSEAEAARARDALRLAALRRFDNLGRIDHVDDPTSAVALLREVEAPEQLRGWRLSAVEALEQPIASVVLPGWKDVAFTPDGARLATRKDDDTVHVWPVDGRDAPVVLGARDGAAIGDSALSPDGRLVAIGYRDGLVRVYPGDGDGPPLELRGPGNQITGVHWQADARHLLVNSTHRQPGVATYSSQLWDLDDPTAAVALPRDAETMSAGTLAFVSTTHPTSTAGVWRSDGGKLLEFPAARRLVPAPAGDSLLLLTDRALTPRGLDGAALGRPLDHTALLRPDETLAIAHYTPDGARVVATTSEDRMFLWDLATATLLRELPAPPRPQPGMLQWGLQLAFSPDSTTLARGYADRTVHVWDLRGHHAPLILRGHLHEPAALAFSPDSRTLATSTIYVRGFSKTEGLQRERGDFDHAIRLWPIPADRTVRFAAYPGTAGEADLKWISHDPWTPDGRALVVVDGLTLRLVDPTGAPAAPPLTLPAAHEHAWQPIFTADGRHAILEAADHWIRWDLQQPDRFDAVAKPPRAERAAPTPREHGGGASDLSRAGDLVYYLSPDRTSLRVHRFADHAVVRTLAHDAPVERAMFSPQGDRILTVTKDRHVRVWSLVDDAPPAVHAATGTGAVLTHWSPDGTFVVFGVGTSVQGENAIHVWRPGEPGEPDHRLTAPTVLTLARLSPDGRHLALIGRDDRVRVISTAGDRTVRELDPIDSEPGRLAFSPDGAWLISQASHAAYVWSTATGALVRVLRSPEHLTHAGFDPTGARVLLAARDGSLTVAPFDPELARASLQDRLRAATSYCYSHQRRRIDLGEPADLAWTHYAACERAHGRDPGPAPAAP